MSNPSQPSHGDPVQQRLHALQAQVEALVAAEDRRRRRGRLLARVTALGALVALPLFSGVGRAADGNCPNALPFCFAAGSPALASQINHNFDQLHEWLEAKVGSVGDGWIQLDGVSDVTASAGGGLVMTGSGGTLRVDENEVNATGGLHLNRESGAQVTFMDEATNISRVQGDVADDNISNAPYSRLNIDSLHTNGLGVGQMYIEGSNMDANTDIHIGAGHAGGQGTQTVRVGAALRGEDGTLNLGLRLATCASGSAVTDCYCNSGEVAISGGAWATAANNHVIRESRPYYDSATRRYGWRVACADRDDGQSNDIWCGSGNGAADSVFVICAPFDMTGP